MTLTGCDGSAWVEEDDGSSRAEEVIDAAEERRVCKETHNLVTMRCSKSILIEVKPLTSRVRGVEVAAAMGGCCSRGDEWDEDEGWSEDDEDAEGSCSKSVTFIHSIFNHSIFDHPDICKLYMVADNHIGSTNHHLFPEGFFIILRVLSRNVVPDRAFLQKFPISNLAYALTNSINEA